MIQLLLQQWFCIQCQSIYANIMGETLWGARLGLSIFKHAKGKSNLEI